MSEAENSTLIEMTADLIAAYVTKNHVRAAELPELISTVHAALAGMGSAPVAEPEPDKLVPPVSIKKSITDDYLVSLEDGQRYKSLKRHLNVPRADPGGVPGEMGPAGRLPDGGAGLRGGSGRSWRRASGSAAFGGRGDERARRGSYRLGHS